MLEQTKMKCGHCGNDTFSIYADSKTTFLVECVSCKNTSTIKPSQPTLQIGWGENSQGVLYA